MTMRIVRTLCSRVSESKPLFCSGFYRSVSSSCNGLNLLHNARLNKGTATSLEDRKKYNLEGLLPPRVLSQELQLARCVEFLKHYTNPLDKYMYLMSLLERNERLFFKLMDEHLEELMPVVYTPTVGDACLKFGHIFQQPRGLYLSIQQQGSIEKVVANWPQTDVQVIVMTDGERILGLGDQGVQGMGIPIGKLLLYTACGGVDPSVTLPVQLDVGTNNENLLHDPLYPGLLENRLRGSQYDEFIEEVISAFQSRFGQDVLIQFEDFGNQNALRLLDKFRNKCCTFNDDIQGTAAVALAGLFGSLRVEKAPSKLSDHKILFFGSGSAAGGIAELVVQQCVAEGKQESDARKQIWFVDSRGLIHRDRLDELTAQKKLYAHSLPNGVPSSGDSVTKLADIVQHIRPTALIGVSTIGGAFTPQVLRLMGTINERPLVFALSNPTSRAECTAYSAYSETDGRAIYVSGSPFPPVTLPDGRRFYPGQGNNALCFPGIGLGAMLSNTKHITDSMFRAAARTLGELTPEDSIQSGCMYPPLYDIKTCSAHIAKAVIDVSIKENLVLDPKSVTSLSTQQIHSKMYNPNY
mmetsp:Transcript_2561/g.4501  ORF Transcript_2561/g.4501 Transcript_2561/m.4501 type:complete len:581 (-) Transcript_2561:1448-3190(-)